MARHCHRVQQWGRMSHLTCITDPMIIRTWVMVWCLPSRQPHPPPLWPETSLPAVQSVAYTAIQHVFMALVVCITVVPVVGSIAVPPDSYILSGSALAHIPTIMCSEIGNFTYVNSNGRQRNGCFSIWNNMDIRYTLCATCMPWHL